MNWISFKSIMFDIYLRHSFKRAGAASCWDKRRQWIDGLLYGIWYRSDTFYYVLLYNNIFNSGCPCKASHIINWNWRSRNKTEETCDEIELQTFCLENSMMQFFVKWLIDKSHCHECFQTTLNMSITGKIFVLKHLNQTEYSTRKCRLTLRINRIILHICFWNWSRKDISASYLIVMEDRLIESCCLVRSFLLFLSFWNTFIGLHSRCQFNFVIIIVVETLCSKMSHVFDDISSQHFHATLATPKPNNVIAVIIFSKTKITNIIRFCFSKRICSSIYALFVKDKQIDWLNCIWNWGFNIE